MTLTFFSLYILFDFPLALPLYIVSVEQQSVCVCVCVCVSVRLCVQGGQFEADLQELTDVAPVDTHGGDFGAAVFMELIATSLASEAVEQELLTDVTEGQLQKCFPNLTGGVSGYFKIATGAQKFHNFAKVPCFKIPCTLNIMWHKI